MFFWVLTPCCLVGRYQRFEETYCFKLYSLALKMETVCFSETSLSAKESVGRHNSEQQHCSSYYSENLKSLKGRDHF
jgi:hypothetical protein